MSVHIIFVERGFLLHLKHIARRPLQELGMLGVFPIGWG